MTFPNKMFSSHIDKKDPFHALANGDFSFVN